MANEANIGVRVGGDVLPLKRAMGEGKRSLKDFGNEVKINAGDVAKWSAGVAAAAATAAFAILKSSTESAKEIRALSNVAGVSVVEFQKMAAASRTVGVEQDKLADIFKDTRDKVGDFLSTGAGPMADFFENIAPLVGVTAEEFRNLSGSDALQLYVNSLEKANISQSEMTFYMEAIASDATLLLPLLEDSGKAMNQIATETEQAGRVLSELELSQLEVAARTMDDLQEASRVATSRIAIQLAPVLDALVDKMWVLENAVIVVRAAFKGMEAAFWGVSVVLNTVLAEVGKFADALFQDVLKGVNTVIDGLNEIPGVDIANIIYGNDLSNNLQGGADIAKEHLRKTLGEMNDILMGESTLGGGDTGPIAVPGIPSPEDIEQQGEMSLQAQTDLQDQILQQLANHNAARVAQLGAAHAQEVAQEKAAADKRKAIMKNVSDAIGDIAGDSAQKLFEITKQGNLSGAINDAKTAIIGSYKAGAKIGGPLVGASFAAATVISTGQMIADLASDTFGNRSAPSSTPSATVPDTAAGAGAGGGGGGQSNTLFVEGIDPNALFTGDSVSALAEKLLEFQRDGGTVVLA